MNSTSSTSSNSQSTTNNEVFVDLVLISTDLQANDTILLSKRLATAISMKKTIVSGMVNVLGHEGKYHLKVAHWDETYCSHEISKLVTEPLSQLIQILIQKPIKESSIMKLLSLRNIKNSTTNYNNVYGLTTESLLEKIYVVQNGNTGMPSMVADNKNSILDCSESVGIRLAVDDLTFKGQNLLNT